MGIQVSVTERWFSVTIVHLLHGCVSCITVATSSQGAFLQIFHIQSVASYLDN